MRQQPDPKTSHQERPQSAAVGVTISNEDSVWVFRSGQKFTVSIRALIQEARNSRYRLILGRGTG